MFDKDRFIEECRAALKESNTQAAIRELVTRAVSDPAQIVRALGEPKRSGVETIYKAGDLTIQLDEPNDFHAKAIEQDAATIAAILGEWFTGVTRVLVHREATRADEKPRRVTDEMVKAERLSGLRRKDKILDTAIDVLDLEIAD